MEVSNALAGVAAHLVRRSPTPKPPPDFDVGEQGEKRVAGLKRDTDARHNDPQIFNAAAR